MRLFRCCFVGALYGLLAGCAALDGFFLPSADGAGDATAGTVGGVLSGIPGGPWTIIGLALTFGRHAYVEIKHQQLIAAGKKDDNHDGREDEPPPVTPAT